MPATAKRCYYEVLGVQRDRERGRHEGRVSASWRCSTIPTAIPATRTASTASRKSMRPTTSSRMAQARRLRPLRPRRLRAGHGRRRARLRRRFRLGLLRHLRRHLRHGRRARSAPRGRERGADLRFNMEITLEEAYAGKTAQMRLPTSVTCEACSGTGAKAGTKPKTCQHCNGHGRIRHTQGGFFTLERTCPICQGRGQVIEDPCPSCSGSGRVTRERTLSVNIPPGVEDGTRIRLANEGEAGVRGGPPGDLYIFLSLAAARVLPARRRRPALPRAGVDGDRGARRRVRGAVDRRQQGAGQGSGRNPVGAAVPADRQGHAGAALETDRRHVRPGRGRDAAEPDQAPARAFGRIREAVVPGNPAGGLRLLRQGQGLLRQQRPLGQACGSWS